MADDLKRAKKTIDRLAKNPAGSKEAADQLLVTTEIVYKKAPDRADCHSAQFSIEGAVNEMMPDQLIRSLKTEDRYSGKDD